MFVGVTMIIFLFLILSVSLSVLLNRLQQLDWNFTVVFHATAAAYIIIHIDMNRQPQ